MRPLNFDLVYRNHTRSTIVCITSHNFAMHAGISLMMIIYRLLLFVILIVMAVKADCLIVTYRAVLRL